jgi:amino acid transporter
VSLAFVVLFKHGFSVDTPQLKLKGLSLHGLSLGVVASIFSLVGFESATALGGEAAVPGPHIPLYLPRLHGPRRRLALHSQ